MGVLGGLQVLRAHKKDTFEDPNLQKNIFHTILPWGCGCNSCCCKKTEEETRDRQLYDKHKSTKIWRKRVDFNAFLYVGFLTALVVTKVALDLTYGENESSE